MAGPAPSAAAYSAGTVELAAVAKSFGTAVAVDGISLRIPGGSYCCLLGPSGCGKTTTLRMIAGHEQPTGGDIFIGPEDVTQLPPGKRRTAMMFQSYALFPHLNRARQCRVQPQAARRRQDRAARPGARPAAAGPYAGLCRAAAGAAVGRAAAARRAGPRADHQSDRAAARRAAVGARSLSAHPGARGAQAAPDGTRHDLHPCHPFPRGSAGAGPIWWS